MARYLITLSLFMDGDEEDTDAVKEWVEEALDSGAIDANILAITTQEEEEDE